MIHIFFNSRARALQSRTVPPERWCFSGEKGRSYTKLHGGRGRHDKRRQTGRERGSSVETGGFSPQQDKKKKKKRPAGTGGFERCSFSMDSTERVSTSVS
ncbi:hypothetical protein MHYP_G00037320 [Metynnis hypsauchen]